LSDPDVYWGKKKTLEVCRGGSKEEKRSARRGKKNQKFGRSGALT